MAVVGNTCSEIGDVMIVTMDTPITGVRQINNFTDNSVGETATRFFEKKFRYSLDGGLNFNPEGYLDLNPTNLSVIVIDPSYDLIVEYRYERAGTDTTGLLEWSETTLSTSSYSYVSGIAFDNSVFRYFFETSYQPSMLSWSLNVLEKLYSPGILPQSMTRNENQNIDQEDRDFIDFWRAITHYYALFVCYARAFEDFRNNQQLIVEYLRQRGIYVCESQTLADLQYIQENFWDEMRHRGTAMIAKKKGDDISGTPKPVDGELLRLLCYNDECDEFLFGISEFDSIGWVVDRWSPLWRGLTHQAQFTKIYERTQKVSDLTKYPLINAGDVAIVSDSDAGIPVMSITSVAAGDSSGIGTRNGNYNADFATNVDPSLPYELSFVVKSDVTSGDVKLTVGLFGYTSDGTATSFQAMDTASLVDQDIAIDEVELNDGYWHKISVILHPFNSAFDSDPNYRLPNINAGTNLRFKSESTCKVIPRIVLDNTSGGSSSGEMRIYGMRFAPAYTEYSTGFVNTANFLQTWTKNNQGNYTDSQIETIIKNELIPYTVTLQNNYL